MHTNLGIDRSNKMVPCDYCFNLCYLRLLGHIRYIILGPYLRPNVVQSNHDMLTCIGVKGLLANLELMMHIHDSPLSIFLKKERRESLKQLP